MLPPIIWPTKIFKLKSRYALKIENTLRRPSYLIIRQKATGRLPGFQKIVKTHKTENKEIVALK